MATGSHRADLPAETNLWREDGDEAPNGILVSGILRSVYHGHDGRRHVMGLSFPGEPVGGTQMRPGFAVEAATAVRVCHLSPRVHARFLADHPGFRRKLRRQAEIDLERLRYLTLALGALGAEQRLASFLSMMTGIMPWQPSPGGGGILTVLLPRADIADLLAISVETISRITRRWERHGLIRIHDPRRFGIPDPARLARMGKLDPASAAAQLFAGADLPGSGRVPTERLRGEWVVPHRR